MEQTEQRQSMLGTREAAAYIGGISRSHLLSIVRSGAGPAHYIFGGQYRFRPADLDAWVASRRIDPGAEAGDS